MTTTNSEIVGAFGGGGGGSQPIEAPESLRSVATARILDLLCEGPIEGVVGGARGVYLDDVQLQKPDSADFNFKVSAIAFRNGSDAQTPIEGIPSAEVEIAVSVDVTHATPAIRTVTTEGLDAMRITMGFPGMTHIETNGDINGATVEFQVEVQPFGGAYSIIDLAGSGFLTGKTSSRFQRTVEFKLPGVAPWNIRVSRLTDDHASVTYTDKSYWDSYTEVQYEKLSYPGSALVGIELDASQFRSIPRRAYDTKLLIVQVPSNYDPVTRAYTGAWDGTFKSAWTDNPAWCLYDLLTHADHGLGAYITSAQVDKWALYEIAQICDELVDNGDGLGGKEPRFTCNLLLTSRTDAWRVVQDICSIFRGLAYWVSGTVQPVQDSPRDPVALFTPSNVIEGKFSYSGSSRMSRHNTVLVSWNDPTDMYRQKKELVMLDADVAARGLRQVEIQAIGCTSQGQAHRVGRWLLYTEIYETETITFSTGLDGATVRPGDVIVVQDDYRAPTVSSGRVSNTPTSATVVPLDATVSLESGKSYNLQVFTGNATTPFETVAVASLAGDHASLTLSAALSTPPVDGAAWQLLESTGEQALYRILSIVEAEPNIYSITAMEYDPNKYDFVESNLNLQAPPGGITNPAAVLVPPANLGIDEYLYISGEAVKDRMNVHWDAVSGAAGYFGQWRKDNGNWTNVDTMDLAFDVLDVNPGLYEARVCAVAATGGHGLFSRATVTLLGKTAPPANVANFTATRGATTIALSWDAVADLDLSH